MISAALTLPVLLGVGGLVVEYGGGLVEDARNQRVADLASYAGAIAYAETKSQERMTQAAQNIAVLNGIAASDVEAILEDSPQNSGSKAVHVQIRTQRELFLSKLLNTRTELNVYAGAMAEVGGKGTPGCILALSSSQTGVTLSGGTKIDAPTCSVSSNNTVTAPCGTKIWTIGINYNSANPPAEPCDDILKGPNGVDRPVIARQPTPDPLAGHAGIAAAFKRITDSFSSLAAMTAPTAPAKMSGSTLNFTWGGNASSVAAAMGCSAAQNGSTWTFGCPSNKTQVNIDKINIDGGFVLDFAVNGSPNTTYNISEKLELPWSTIRFGSGTFNFAESVTTQGTTSFGNGTFHFGKQLIIKGETVTFGTGSFNFSRGLSTEGNVNVTFGAGTFKFGQTETSCNNARYSICHSGKTLTFGGPSTFELYAGFYNNGGSTITFGSGSTNSFKIGPSSNGKAIELGGGSRTYMADATGAGSVFQVKGHVNAFGGNSCLKTSAAANHDIDGNFTTNGAVELGSGIYTVNGYVALGESYGGGGGCPYDTSISFKGVDVSLIISGKSASSTWPCSGYTFCVAAGYSGVQLTAPQTGALAKLAVAGPQDAARTGGATFTQGGSGGKVSGAFYFPNGPVEMSGGAGMSGGGGSENCLQLIGSRITMSGGTTMASECIAAAGASGSDKISLIR